MTLLIFGLFLWFAAHALKRAFPDFRAKLGDKGKGGVALVLLLSILMMVIGYRSAAVSPVYTPMAGMGHVNNLLMLLSIFMFGAGSAKGVIASRVRHSMLWGTALWAVAHLLVNGDLASIILFGGIGFWAFFQMSLINRGDGAWVRPTAGPIAKDMRVILITLILYAAISVIHIWLGYNPFLGT